MLACLARATRPPRERCSSSWIEQRLVVIVLLDRAQGSVHEASAQRFVERPVTLSIAEIRMAYAA